MNTDNYLSISELSDLLNETLIEEFGTIYFQGELTEVKNASSGHYYFSIKDAESVLNCAMWRTYVGKLNFQPKDGIQVLCQGYPNIYKKSGRFSIVVKTMIVAGEGALKKKFIELQNKLKKEGLFDESRKRPLPILPKSLGLITSAKGAALQDMLVILNERLPTVEKRLIDVRVQGSEAISEIKNAIKKFNDLNNVDLIILARGGGSLEDLWAFNEEDVVRAIFASKIPIICGVGHETDISLSDLAADKRAATPTAAAKIAVPDKNELLQTLDYYEEKLNDILDLFKNLTEKLDNLLHKLNIQSDNLIQSFNLKLKTLSSNLKLIKPDKLFENLQEKMNFLSKRNFEAMSKKIKFDTSKIDQIEHRAFASNPKQILKRGFAIVKRKDKLVGSIKNISKDDILTTELKDGVFSSTVIDK